MAEKAQLARKLDQPASQPVMQLSWAIIVIIIIIVQSGWISLIVHTQLRVFNKTASSKESCIHFFECEKFAVGIKYMLYAFN